MFSLLCRSIGINPLGSQAPEADRNLATYSYLAQQEASPATPSATARRLKRAFKSSPWLQKALMMVTITATCMVLGDGVFTPAISGEPCM